MKRKHRLVILGGSESGVGAALLGAKKGYDVFLSDSSTIKDYYKKELEQHQISFEEEQHNEEKILRSDEIMKSPGIPERAAIVKKIREKKIPVISEIELAYRFKGDSIVIAITGSNGKSTTTSLIYHICITAGLDAALVGNIGYSFAKQVAENPKPIYVVEVSSFQLDDIKTFKPNVAILLNITEDHLDRYEYKFQNYINSKFRIIENQTAADFFIYNDDDPVIQQQLLTIPLQTNLLPFSMTHEVKKGAYSKGGEVQVLKPEKKLYNAIYKEHGPLSLGVKDFVLKGKHNIANTMAGAVASNVIGIRDATIREALKSYEGLEHRMEVVTQIAGVEYINDSKATNINSTWFALENMQVPTILILGGQDKGNDYSLLHELVKEKVKAIVCLGVDNKNIVAAFKNIVPQIFETKNMKDAVRECTQLAAPNNVVLLSPACASFDLFTDYQDRGRQFKQAVLELL